MPSKIHQVPREGEIIYCQWHQESLHGEIDICGEPHRMGRISICSLDKEGNIQEKQRKARSHKSAECIHGTRVWLECRTSLLSKYIKGGDNIKKVVRNQIVEDPKNPI